MDTLSDIGLSLTLPARLQLLPILQALVENGCAFLEMSRQQTLRLTMAGEELFAHVCSTQPQTKVQISMYPRATGVSLTLCFFRPDVDFSGLNMHMLEGKFFDNPKNLGMMGLSLASQMVNGFSLDQKDNMLTVTLQQDSNYPEDPIRASTTKKAESQLHIAEKSDVHAIVDACHQVQSIYELRFQPSGLETPGKIADQVMYGELFAARLVDPHNETCGFIYWKHLSDKSVGFYGPYVFIEQPEQAAVLLMEEMVSKLTNTQTKTVFSLLATNELPKGFMAPLADICYQSSTRTTYQIRLYYRHLAKDESCTIWGHPLIIPFLHASYETLELPRDILPVSNLGKKRHAHSVLSVIREKNLNQATLSAMVDGTDIADNIATHLKNLQMEGILNIFYHLDMALAWQACTGKILLDNGFVPSHILPQAGSADILVFQHTPSQD